MTDSIRVMAGRIGGHRTHARHDSKEISRRGSEAFLARFEREVLAEAAERGEELSRAEVARRAGHLRSAYFSALALRSAQARRDRKGES